MSVYITRIVAIIFNLTETKLTLNGKNPIFQCNRGLTCKFCIGLENNQTAQHNRHRRICFTQEEGLKNGC